MRGRLRATVQVRQILAERHFRPCFPVRTLMGGGGKSALVDTDEPAMKLVSSTSFRFESQSLPMAPGEASACVCRPRRPHLPAGGGRCAPPCRQPPGRGAGSSGGARDRQHEGPGGRSARQGGRCGRRRQRPRQVGSPHCGAGAQMSSLARGGATEERGWREVTRLRAVAVRGPNFRSADRALAAREQEASKMVPERAPAVMTSQTFFFFFFSFLLRIFPSRSVSVVTLAPSPSLLTERTPLSCAPRPASGPRPFLC